MTDVLRRKGEGAEANRRKHRLREWRDALQDARHRSRTEAQRKARDGFPPAACREPTALLVSSGTSSFHACKRMHFSSISHPFVALLRQPWETLEGLSLHEGHLAEGSETPAQDPGLRKFPSNSYGITLPSLNKAKNLSTARLSASVKYTPYPGEYCES